MNLLSSSENFIRGSGNTQMLEYASIINNGFVLFSPTGSGMRIQTGGSFINGIGWNSSLLIYVGGMFLVNTTATTDTFVGSGSGTNTFLNNGTIVVEIPVRFYITIIYVPLERPHLHHGGCIVELG